MEIEDTNDNGLSVQEAAQAVIAIATGVALIAKGLDALFGD